MNTGTAAIQAGVTPATIRTWCRRNVIAAVKTGGRWAINAASLAHRIALKPRKEKPTMDLAATYTTTYAGDTAPTTITPKFRTRDRDGVQVTTVRGFEPLLADRIDAIADQGDRGHTLQLLSRAVIAIRDQAGEDDEAGAYSLITYRDHGRLSTSYCGTRDLPIEVVLDLAAQIRDALKGQH